MANEELKNEVQTEEPQSEQTPPEIDYKAEYERLMRDNDKLKRAQSNASADVSRLKKELESRMSEAELAEKKRNDYIAELESKNAAYEAEATYNHNVKGLLEVGYDTAAADKIAKTLPGKMDASFFDGQKEFLSNMKSKLMAEALNQQPGLTAGTAPTAKMVEESEKDQLRGWFGLK